MAYSGTIYYLGDLDALPAKHGVHTEMWKMTVVNGVIETNAPHYEEDLSVLDPNFHIHLVIDEAIDGVEE